MTKSTEQTASHNYSRCSLDWVLCRSQRDRRRSSASPSLDTISRDLAMRVLRYFMARGSVRAIACRTGRSLIAVWTDAECVRDRGQRQTHAGSRNDVNRPASQFNMGGSNPEYIADFSGRSGTARTI